MFLLPILYIVSTVISIQTDAAPAGPRSTAYMSSNSQFHQSALEWVLKDAIFNSTDNFYTIRKAFQPQQGTHKLCIPIAYNITCTNQEECDSKSSSFNCTSGYYFPVIWTEFDTTDAAGKLIYFALVGLGVLGFDWAGTCDVPEDPDGDSWTSVPTLDLAIPQLPCDMESLNHTLLYITTMVSIV